MYFAIWVRFAFLSSLVVLRADYSAFIFRVLPSGEIARKRKRVTDEEDMVDLIALDDGSLISVLRSHGANSLHIERYDTDGNVTLEYYNPPARPTSASSSPDGGLYLAGTVYAEYGTYYEGIVHISRYFEEIWSCPVPVWARSIAAINDSSGLCAVGGSYVSRIDGPGNMLWSRIIDDIPSLQFVDLAVSASGLSVFVGWPSNGAETVVRDHGGFVCVHHNMVAGRVLLWYPAEDPAPRIPFCSRRPLESNYRKSLER
jgi:hypothetical protein